MGARIPVGGFGVCGNPSVLIQALRESGATDLEVVSDLPYWLVDSEQPLGKTGSANTARKHRNSHIAILPVPKRVRKGWGAAVLDSKAVEKLSRQLTPHLSKIPALFIAESSWP